VSARFLHLNDLSALVSSSPVNVLNLSCLFALSGFFYYFKIFSFRARQGRSRPGRLVMWAFLGMAAVNAIRVIRIGGETLFAKLGLSDWRWIVVYFVAVGCAEATSLVVALRFSTRREKLSTRRLARFLVVASLLAIAVMTTSWVLGSGSADRPAAQTLSLPTSIAFVVLQFVNGAGVLVFALRFRYLSTRALVRRLLVRAVLAIAIVTFCAFVLRTAFERFPVRSETIGLLMAGFIVFVIASQFATLERFVIRRLRVLGVGTKLASLEGLERFNRRILMTLDLRSLTALLEERCSTPIHSTRTCSSSGRRRIGAFIWPGAAVVTPRMLLMRILRWCGSLIVM
jgi:hypothetical protein